MPGIAENLVFIFPETLEESLYALPVMGQCLENRLVSGRDTEHVHVVCPIREIHELVKACWQGMSIDDKYCSAKRNVADITMEFDPDRAYEITETTQKPIGSAYGIIIGAEPMTTFPPVLEKIGAERRGSVLVVGRKHCLDREEEDDVWPEAEEFVSQGEADGIAMSLFNPICSFVALVAQVSMASVVVGVRSSATLLGATFNKIVMELDPVNTHRNWMAKWESRKYSLYRAVSGMDDLTAEMVWTRTKDRVSQMGRRDEKTWEHHYSSTQRGEEELTRTAR